MRAFMFFIGVSTYSHTRPDVDYSKWLGPDWKPKYEGASIVVSNHCGWVEVFFTFLFVRPMPSFIAKTGIKQVPSIGTIATAVGSMWMDRQDKAQRVQMFHKILDR